MGLSGRATFSELFPPFTPVLEQLDFYWREFHCSDILHNAEIIDLEFGDLGVDHNWLFQELIQTGVSYSWTCMDYLFQSSPTATNTQWKTLMELTFISIWKALRF